MGDIDYNKLAEALIKALNNSGAFKGGASSYVNNTSTNKQLTGNEGSNDATTIYAEMRDFAKSLRSINNTFDEQTKTLDEVQRRYNRVKGRYNEEERKLFETRMSLERNMVEHQKKMNSLQLQYADKTAEIQNRKQRIDEQNFAHEVEMENRRTKFMEENLKTQQELEKRSQSRSQINEKLENEIKKKNTDSKGRDNYRSQMEIVKKIDNAKRQWNGSSGSGKFGLVGSAVGKVAGGLGQGFGNFMNKDKVSISDVGNKVAGVAEQFGGVGKAIGGIIKLVTAVLEQMDKINKASSDYARNVGGGARKMEEMKTWSTDVASNISEWGGLAYKFDKILEHTAELSEKTGRMMDKMSQEDIKSMEDLNRWGISSDVLNQYDTFGLSVEEIDKKIANIYNTSGKHGLNAKAVTSQVTKNLKMAQQYTFQGGLRALERMAQKATALKIDMSAANGFAEKVSTLEGAASAGARLSVLGGDYARMSNPLDLLYGGVQDEEVLFDRMLEMTKNSVKWDDNKHEFSMSAFNRQQMKAAAEAMGVDYNSLSTQAFNQARLSRVEDQFNSAGVTDDTKEYIKNLAQIDSAGTAYVSFHNSDGSIERKDVSKLTDEDKEKLQQESEAYGESGDKVGTIVMRTRTMTERLNDILDVLKTQIYKTLAGLARHFMTDEEYAAAAGLNKANAEYFEDLSDNYSNGGLDAQGIRRVKAMNLNKDIEDKIINRKLEDDEFDEILRNQLSMLQNLGLTKNETDGNNTESSNIFYSKYKDNNAQWVDKDGNIITEGSEAYNRLLNINAPGHANGRFGEIQGVGGEKQDLEPAWLSPHETVLPANISKAHAPQIHSWFGEKYADGKDNFRNGSNLFNTMKVKASNIASDIKNSLYGSLTSNKIEIPPIDLNFNGKIDLISNSTSLGEILAKEFKSNSRLTKAIAEEIKKALNNNIYIKTSMADSAN